MNLANGELTNIARQLISSSAHQLLKRKIILRCRNNAVPVPILCLFCFGASRFNRRARTGAQHGHIITLDIGDISFDAVFVFILALSDSAFHKDSIPLFKVILGNFRQTPPEHDIVPFGMVYLLAFLVAIYFCSCQGKNSFFSPRFPTV